MFGFTDLAHSGEEYDASDVRDFISEYVLGRNATIGVEYVSGPARPGHFYYGVVNFLTLSPHFGDEKVVVNIVVNGENVRLEHQDGDYADTRFSFINCD